jgi:thiol-disulfide isomerase/thioredoxin
MRLKKHLYLSLNLKTHNMKNLFTLFAMVLFSSVAFAQENMAFQAKIENRNGDILYIKDNKTVVQEIKLNPKGLFQAQFPIKEGMYQLFDGAEYAQVFLKNGYDLKMTMDATQFDESIKFEGKGSKENNFLAEETRNDEKFDFNQVLTLDEVAFTRAVEDKKKGDFERLEKAGLDPYLVQTYKNSVEQSFQGLKQYHAQISANKKMNNTVSAGFDYENHKGGKTTLASLKGKYVYIDVWATWCGPCRAEIPSLKTVEEKYHNKNIEFVSISVDVDKDHEKWKNFVTEKQLGGTQLYADKNWLSDFITAYKINSIPRFILIDPKGNIVDADAARPSDPKLQEQLDSLLQ